MPGEGSSPPGRPPLQDWASIRDISAAAAAAVALPGVNDLLTLSVTAQLHPRVNDCRLRGLRIAGEVRNAMQCNAMRILSRSTLL